MVTKFVWCGALVAILTLLVVPVASEQASCHDDKPCPEDEYCDQHSFSCSPCSDICSSVMTRVDCSKKCKDYLILQRIATLENNLYTTIIIFAIILLLLALTVVVIIVRWCRKSSHFSWSFLKRLIAREKSNPPTMEYTHENPHTKSPKLSTRAGSNSTGLPPLPQVSTIGPPSTYMGSDGASSVQTVTTPISARYPAEDWRMNHAYDNGGLAITPTENTYEYVEAKMNQRRQLPFPN
ncbi:protein grindelwald-like [Ochlerotatus camptorhynchus]|uniref:protein grindelwald-like n=1 Tax=Ochlerotatus camptorhynchus TaxID=644619 RepID=UPI0031E339C1